MLITLPGVRDCAIFGIPDEEYGEAVCAYVEPQDGERLSADDVRSFLRLHVAGYKVPKLVEFRDVLPREDSGKIFKRKLRAPYWAGAGRQIRAVGVAEGPEPGVMGRSGAARGTAARGSAGLDPG